MCAHYTILYCLTPAEYCVQTVTDCPDAIWIKLIVYNIILLWDDSNANSTNENTQWHFIISVSGNARLKQWKKNRLRELLINICSFEYKQLCRFIGFKLGNNSVKMACLNSLSLGAFYCFFARFLPTEKGT